MVCKKPFHRGVLKFGCGQCMPCRVSRRRVWSHRILLESFTHKFNSFVTLTYSDEHCVKDSRGIMVLEHGDVQRFLKKVRNHFGKVRYFVVGEYGEESWRPHYHLALFGYPSCWYGRSRYRQGLENCCEPCDLIRDCWSKGHVDLGSLTSYSAQYICGYVTKKMTKKDDPRLGGRPPEYSRMSLRPGIGAKAMSTVVDALVTDFGADELLASGDVPMSLRHGRKDLPLGRYLREKIREYYGFEEKGTPKEVLFELSEKMCELHERDVEAAKAQKKSLWLYKKEEKVQKIRNLESKQNVFSKKGSL